MFNWQDVTSWAVLLVDDEPDNLEVAAETLEYHGAKVRTALNGVEAIAVLEDFNPNLIITDLSMPLMDGWVLRGKIKTMPELADIPLLALSAHAMTGDKERALAVGFDGYLTKPINIMSLVEDIQAAAQEKTR
jgi:CheY-like chemotaxis protein